MSPHNHSGHSSHNSYCYSVTTQPLRSLISQQLLLQCHHTTTQVTHLTTVIVTVSPHNHSGHSSHNSYCCSVTTQPLRSLISQQLLLQCHHTATQVTHLTTVIVAVSPHNHSGHSSHNSYCYSVTTQPLRSLISQQLLLQCHHTTTQVTHLTTVIVAVSPHNHSGHSSHTSYCYSVTTQPLRSLVSQQLLLQCHHTTTQVTHLTIVIVTVSPHNHSGHSSHNSYCYSVTTQPLRSLISQQLLLQCHHTTTQVTCLTIVIVAVSTHNHSGHSSHNSYCYSVTTQPLRSLVSQ